MPPTTERAPKPFIPTDSQIRDAAWRMAWRDVFGRARGMPRPPDEGEDEGRERAKAGA